jgi:hypothetical protein
MQFDIVICLGPHDIHIIHEMIIQTKQNVVGYRNIYIVSYDKNIKVDGCITIDENIFPFNKAFISKYIQPNQKIKEDRSGWYLQQLLKLYSCFSLIAFCKEFFTRKKEHKAPFVSEYET